MSNSVGGSPKTVSRGHSRAHSRTGSVGSVDSVDSFASFLTPLQFMAPTIRQSLYSIPKSVKQVEECIPLEKSFYALYIPKDPEHYISLENFNPLQLND